MELFPPGGESAGDVTPVDAKEYDVEDWEAVEELRVWVVGMCPDALARPVNGER